MPIASGSRPYTYTRYPFILNEGEKIALSGILLEEAMFAVLADREIFEDVDGSNRYYYKYFGNGTPEDYAKKVGFEPRADGGNLDGSWQYPVSDFADNPLYKKPGVVNFQDYILDMRTKMELLFTKMNEVDCEASAEQIKGAHLSGVKTNLGLADEDYTAEDWLHDSTTLGESGVLYDVDYREVQWQPLLRFSKWKANGSYHSPSEPIGPCFQTTAGATINPTARDLSKAAAVGGNDEIAYNAANSNRIAFYGDGFSTSVYAYMFDMWSDKRQGGTLSCTSVASRTINQAMAGGIGYFSPAACGSGIKRLFIWDSDAGAAPSSMLGFWPVRTGYELQDISPSRNTRLTNDGIVYLSGLQIFNDYFAVLGAAGVQVMSPLNSDILWTRHSDDSTWSVSDIYGNSANGAWVSLAGWNGSIYQYGNFLNESIPASISFYITVYVVNWDGASLDLGGVTSSGPWTRSDSFATSNPGMPDVSQHSPVLGESLAGFSVINQREGSDNVAYEVIWDGSNSRGAIFSNQPNTTSPNTNGTINGELFGKYPDETAPYFKHMRIDRSQDVFPLPPASGLSGAGSYEMDRGNFWIYLDPDTIGHDFEPPTYASPYGDFRVGSQNIMQPTGDLDIGDGSALITFQAKLLGEISLKTFVGRVEMASSGGTEILKITEYWGPIENSPRHTYSV